MNPQGQPRLQRTRLRISGAMSNPQPLEEVSWVWVGEKGREPLRGGASERRESEELNVSETEEGIKKL